MRGEPWWSRQLRDSKTSVPLCINGAVSPTKTNKQKKDIERSVSKKKIESTWNHNSFFLWGGPPCDVSSSKLLEELLITRAECFWGRTKFSNAQQGSLKDTCPVISPYVACRAHSAQETMGQRLSWDCWVAFELIRIKLHVFFLLISTIRIDNLLIPLVVSGQVCCCKTLCESIDSPQLPCHKAHSWRWFCQPLRGPWSPKRLRTMRPVLMVCRVMEQVRVMTKDDRFGCD